MSEPIEEKLLNGTILTTITEAKGNDPTYHGPASRSDPVTGLITPAPSPAELSPLSREVPEEGEA